MATLTSPKIYAALAVFQAGDAIACAIPAKPIAETLDKLGIPHDIRWLLPASKAASVIGLLSASRFPALGRLTTAMLTLYFALAVGAHLRAHDRLVNAVPAASFLATYASLTVKGPHRG
ncbi:DoxX family protein [Candidatus Mycobacterium methanotrophicum]|uniref:DoxX family protein n=1 Tax=Candidatus Mycobacterium methanotrophicum TaxID=2943498 RepID=A0ABY4QHM0_9MYCO|nr:DoxX family protein [Candidatus Mycobacterium methanotrophicum]UQX09321.1 DoxX family protein [Candidatus Mycobacterium methanotrophicum]